MIKESNSKLAENIRIFRTFRNITQEELAKKFNKTKGVISNWEHGANQPSSREVEEICHIFGITPNHLYGWKENEGLKEWERQQAEKQKELDVLEAQFRELKDKVNQFKGN